MIICPTFSAPSEWNPVSRSGRHLLFLQFHYHILPSVGCGCIKVSSLLWSPSPGGVFNLLGRMGYSKGICLADHKISGHNRKIRVLSLYPQVLPQSTRRTQRIGAVLKLRVLCALRGDKTLGFSDSANFCVNLVKSRGFFRIS